MYSKIVTIKHVYGLDTGLCSYIIRAAQLFKSKITIENMITGVKADARLLRELYKLSNTYGTDIRIEAEGDDEQEAVEILSKTFYIFAERKLYDSKEDDLRIKKAFERIESYVLEKREQKKDFPYL